MSLPILTEIEKWRPVLGWEGLYEVSSFGNVRSLKVKALKQKLHIDKAGYYRVTLHNKERGWKNCLVHQLVCSAFYGQKPSKEYVVAHYDGDSKNNYYKNLRWATSKENAHDTMRHGRTTRGEKSGNSKLSSVDVEMIRELCELGFKQKDIGYLWNIDQSHVSRIKSKTFWGYL